MTFGILQCAMASAMLLACVPPEFDGVDVATGRESHARSDPSARVDFTGTYESPQSGKVFLRQEGQEVHGSYALLDCGHSIRGWFAGTIRGNLAKVTWSELQNQNGVWRHYDSDGYFYFADDPALGTAPRLLGEQAYFVTKPAPVGYGTIKLRMHRNLWTATRTGSVPEFPFAPDPPHCAERE